MARPSGHAAGATPVAPLLVAAGERAQRRADLFGREQKILQVAQHMPVLTVDEQHLFAVADVLLSGLVFVELLAELASDGRG